MRSWILKTIIRFAAITIPLHLAAAADNLTLVTAHAPPLSIVSSEDETVTGMSTELLTAILSEAGIHFTITAFPWARALSKARSETDTCVYPAVRTPEREHAYKWIGLVQNNIWTLFGRTGETPPRSLDDVKTRIVGGSLGDAATDYLKEQGFRVDESRDDGLNMRKLQTGRIDYWINNLANGLYLTRQAGETGIVPVLTVKKMPVFLACNPSVPDRLVEDLTSRLQRRAASAGAD